MKQDQHRLLSVQSDCSCSSRLADLEERFDHLHQQLAELLQMFLDLKGEPK